MLACVLASISLSALLAYTKHLFVRSQKQKRKQTIAQSKLSMSPLIVCEQKMKPFLMGYLK